MPLPLEGKVSLKPSAESHACAPKKRKEAETLDSRSGLLCEAAHGHSPMRV